MTNPKHTDTSRSGDLVERLRGDKYTCRENMGCGTMEFCACATMEDAADRIEALEAENERLRNAMVVMDNTVRELTEALREMFEAVCGETGFAQAVRAESGIAYPWPALDLAEAMARAALEGAEAPQSPIPLELKPIHFRLLERGANSRYIGLSNNSGVRMGEHAALGQLMRAGLVRFTEDSQPPGPRMPTPCEITDAGRAALNGKGG